MLLLEPFIKPLHPLLTVVLIHPFSFQQSDQTEYQLPKPSISSLLQTLFDPLLLNHQDRQRFDSCLAHPCHHRRNRHRHQNHRLSQQELKLVEDLSLFFMVQLSFPLLSD